MAIEAEIDAAMKAFRLADSEVEGMESARALRLCWRRALEAAERVRANNGDVIVQIVTSSDGTNVLSTWLAKGA